MGAKRYEKKVFKALDLPDPEEVQEGDYLYVGDWELSESPQAVDAVIEQRLALMRSLQIAAEPLEYSARSLINKEIILTYLEYRETVKNRNSLGKTQDRLDYNALSNKDSYLSLSPPSSIQISLVRGYDPQRYSPDRAGYLAYLHDYAPHLARFFLKRLPLLIPEEDRKMHTYITGSSGSGKSEFMKVLAHSYIVQENPPCLVIIDPHGKFADEVAAQKECIASNRLVYVNPALGPELSSTLNPLELDDPTAAATVAKQLVGVFDQLFKGASHAGLTGNMGALLEPCLAALLRMPDTNLLTLQEAFSSEIKDPLVQKMLSYMPEQQRTFISNEWGKRRYETTKEAVVAKIQSLMNSPHFLNFLCGPSTLDLNDIINNRSIVCFSLQKGELDRETVSAMGSFVMATLQAYVLRKYKSRRHNMIPIHVFVDECQNFISPALTEILEELRKFGLHLTLAQQYAGQRMDPDLTKSVLGNTAVKIAGFNDEKSTHKEMARVMDEDESVLVKLPKRYFLVKSGDKAAVKVSPPATFVDRRNCVDEGLWRQELEQQKDLYYRQVPPPFEVPAEPLEPEKPQPPHTPNLDFV